MSLLVLNQIHFLQNNYLFINFFIMENVKTTESPSGVRVETTKGPIMLDKIYKNDFQKEGTLTAQIRQVVVTKSSYPSKKTSSDMQANIFANSEFGFTGQTFESMNTRVAWIPVPMNAKLEDVAAKLKAAYEKGATIYRVLANQPILDENQKYSIKAGLRTLDQFANTQVVRYPDTEDNKAKGLAGKIWLDPQGRVQYRRTFFWNSPMDDQDGRGKGEPYSSAEIKAELSGASVMQGQTI